MLTYDGGTVLSARNASGLLRCLLTRRPSLPTNHRTPLNLLPKVMASSIRLLYIRRMPEAICLLYIASYTFSVLILAICESLRFHVAYAVAVCVCVHVCVFVHVCVCVYACVRQ